MSYDDTDVEPKRERPAMPVGKLSRRNKGRKKTYKDSQKSKSIGRALGGTRKRRNRKIT